MEAKDTHGASHFLRIMANKLDELTNVGAATALIDGDTARLRKIARELTQLVEDRDERI